MHAVSPAFASNLKSVTQTVKSTCSSRVAVRCSYRSDSFSFPNAIGSTRADWQSSCAILASKVALAENSTSITVCNGNDSVDLSYVPEDMKSGMIQPLTISDFSPAPSHGSNLRVAYQGVPGAYSESAAVKAYPNSSVIPCDQFEVAFLAVENWIADRAVLPVENSLGGSIHRNYDLLLRHRLHIVGEVQIMVHHCLLALPGVSTDSIKRVISHPQALAQTEGSLNKLIPKAAKEAFHDTAAAASYIAENNLNDTAAVASAGAAELYGLQILADGIQDDARNVTRFLMLARDPIIPRTDRSFKTSIVFAAHEHKGTSVLFKVLAAFQFRNISLTKIESRPHHNCPIRIVDDESGEGNLIKQFEYTFYVDFEASMAETRAQNALAEIQEYTSFLRVLGSYPMDMTP